MPSWREHAACRGLYDVMWLDSGSDTARNRAHIANALAICRRCPVLVDCRHWVDQLPPPAMLGVIVAGRVHPLPHPGRKRKREAA